GDVAVGVVALGVGCRSDRGGSEAVGRGRAVGFVVGVAAGPVPVGRGVDEALEVIDRVVGVVLGVGAHGLAVGGQRHLSAGAVVPGGLQLAHLADVFAAAGIGEAVDRVVGVVGARRDDLVGEEDGLLGSIAQAGDVARRVVGVGEVLERPRTAGP